MTNSIENGKIGKEKRIERMTYKMIALDLDGTLKNSHNEITPKTRDALIQCQKNGMIIVLASGRPTPGLRHEAATLELAQYNGVLLSFNGARVYDIKRDRVIYEKVVSKAMADEMYDHAKRYNLACMTYDGDEIVTEDSDDKYVNVEKEINDIKIRSVDDFKAAFDHDVNKVLLTGEPDYLAQIEAEFKAPYEGKLSIYRSSPFFIEVMASGIDKAASLAKLLEAYQMTKDELIAFGDGFNDISMIEYAGLGVAMGNAQDPVKAAANLVTASNDEDGIYVTLKELGLVND